MKKTRSQINVDIGARVEARLNVKAEVPSTSVGRFVDAVTDIFRPFSEARGLQADQIRLQRAEVAIEIARRARRQIEIEGGQADPVPNKILIPLIEKSSNEDINDSTMIERWANLLASASTQKKRATDFCTDSVRDGLCSSRVPGIHYAQ